MKKLALAALALLPITAEADSDFLVKWSIGPGLTFTTPRTHMELEVDVMRKYMAVNGSLYFTSGTADLHTTATGTCFQLMSASKFTGIACDFVASNRNFVLETDINLTGTLKEHDSNGNLLGSALVTMISIQ